MTFNERESIREVIEDFYATGVVDEVLVINNNAAEGTSEEVGQTDAREIHEANQGYGYAIRRGLREAESDLVVLAEPDGTFQASDVVKLLSYSTDCEVVLGTRTTQALIWEDANMGAFLKWGNWVVAKMVEVLFNTRHLSDVGCTYRLLSRRIAKRLASEMRIGGSHAGPEMLMLILADGTEYVEVPVNYLPRVGKSSVTGSKVAAFVLGLQMIRLIVGFRLGRRFS